MEKDKSERDEGLPHPRAKANFLSAATFSWTFPMFRLGYKRDLEVTDLYATLKEHSSNNLGDKFERKWNEEYSKATKRKKEPSLTKVVFSVFGGDIAFFGLFLLFIEVVVRVAQPLLLGRLIRYFTQKQMSAEESGQMAAAHELVTERDAYLYAVGLIGLSTLSAVLIHLYMMGAMHIGMKMRVGLCSLIYRKALRLSKTALGETTVGQIVNLLSNDVNRYDIACISTHYLWIGPLETVIVTYFLWQEIGVASLVGVAALLVAIPLQAWLGRKSSVYRLRTAIRTDERIRLMNEIISGIQVIKMYAWEKSFANMVSNARRKELNEIRKTSYVRALLLSFIIFHSRLAVFMSILAYVITGSSINAEKVFTVISFFNILRQTLTIYFPQGIGQIAEAMVSTKRLQKFMMYEEIQDTSYTCAATNSNSEDNGKQMNDVDKTKSDNTKENGTSKENGPMGVSVTINPKESGEAAIVMDKLTAKWTPDLTENTLNNINLKLPHGSLMAVIGLVGAGKSSLLYAILRELPLSSGSLTLNGGRLSYASQEPWLFAGSVRQNILFGEPYDRERYREVTRVCALRPDLEMMPYGDRTVVGDRGVSLSGGQRARINLARSSSLLYAILRELPLSSGSLTLNGGRLSYASQEPWLFAGSVRQNILFGEPYDRERYREVTRVCALRPDLEMMPYGDRTVVGDRGVSLSGGQRARINLARSFMFFPGYLKNKTRILVTHQLQYLNNLELIIMLDNGNILAQGNYKHIQSSGKDLANLMAKHTESDDSDPSSSHVQRRSSVQSIASSLDDSKMQEEPPETKETHSVGTVSGRVYKSYISASGNFFMVIYCLLLCILTQLFGSGGDFWITYWVNLEEQKLLREQQGVDIHLNLTTNSTSEVTKSNNGTYIYADGDYLLRTTPWFDLTQRTCMYIFTFFIAGVVLVTLIRSFTFVRMCVRASMTLHDNMFNSVTRATMKFFNTNSSGPILNRFSKDMGSIDDMLPGAMIDCLQIGLTIVGIITVVALINYLLLIPTFVIAIIFYYLRRFYLSTSRSIKRLEGVTRSPVFSHLTASLQGLSTIRAFNAQDKLREEFDNHQDLHSSAWYMFVATSRAFGFCLDLFCLIYISLVTLSFLLLGTETFGGNVGLAITQSVALTGMFQWGMRQSAELENQMTSVERVLEYTNLDSEPPLESPPEKKPPPTWPSEGKIEFSKVYLSYVDEEPPVLKNLNFVIKAGDKVGIVGRTGAGKSSLIAALFRLTPTSGDILIDDVSTAQLGLHEVRSKISIIPQEPVLFSGTMRKNLDPFGEYPDSVLWNALEEVDLKDAVSELAGGLHAKMSEGGTNFSVGQRQLVCLARAIVGNNKILIMDEATANVDPQTDALIQKTIRRKFTNCTVLTIAHRLNTIMDSDMVLVMSAGSLVEYNHPYLLLKNSDGIFFKMVEQTGKSTAEALHKIAAECYKKYIDEDDEDDIYNKRASSVTDL
ncbi:multidrug resistance-associated protein 4-like [Nilaparvata lugens]|uniref:multidrug resistance-associated protein 4-like n=2 Tax=Nilaparvata lugens TaxID=108931 RepID=UPI00193E16E1|nr:multidrug resistance-associated protein 4-like [Nilaparvata lugens]